MDFSGPNPRKRRNPSISWRYNFRSIERSTTDYSPNCSYETTRRGWIDLIETILVYKLPQKSQEEIEAMFGLSELKPTKVYQEAQLEAKLATIPRMLDYGLSLEVIARSSDKSIDIVREEARKYRSNPDSDS